ncbi:HAD hydrolase-like protein, partial [Candidatus Bathyarchaeota archaeon]|nr:HAD hydrolase-like protein [Candidatus Bathyarchaeota archaeon]
MILHHGMNENTFQDALGFIFDMDGTLIDSHESHYRAWDRIVREHGEPHEKSDIVRHFGKTTPDIAMALLGELDRETLTSISETKARYFIQEIPASQVIPGAVSLLRVIKNMDKGICLASSNFNFVIKEVIK